MSRSSSPAGLAGVALVLVTLLVLPHALKPYGVYLISAWAVFSIAALGLNLTLGYAGQISLAQAAFVGIGAYTAAILTSAGWPFILAFCLGGLICFGIGWLLGYPALKVQHHYLAFVTLAFTTLAYLVFRNEEWLTNGISGIVNVPRPNVFGFGTTSALSFYYLCLGVLGLLTAALWWLIRSPWGRAFVALRENPVRAASLGVDTRRYTLMAFAIGSAYGGFAGCLYAPLVQYVDPTPFTLTLSLNLLLMVVMGGAGYFFGPFIGAIVALLLPEWLRFAEGLYLILYALMIMVLMIFSPGGLLGLLDRFMARRGGLPAGAAAKASTGQEAALGGPP